MSKDNTFDFAMQANITICFALAVGFASHVAVTLVQMVLTGTTKPSTEKHILEMENQ